MRVQKDEYSKLVEGNRNSVCLGLLENNDVNEMNLLQLQQQKDGTRKIPAFDRQSKQVLTYTSKLSVAILETFIRLFLLMS